MRLQLSLIAVITLGMTPGWVNGQAGVPAAKTPAPSAMSTVPLPGRPFADLTKRYRLIEQYTHRPESVGPGMIGQYHVAMSEVLRDRIEMPDGPAKATEVSRKTVFTERPAEVSSLGIVSATIRKYQRFQTVPDDTKEGTGRRPVEGLSLWYRPQVNEAPLILSLAPERRLTDREYEVASRHIFMPNLASILPGQAVRIGDAWRVNRKGTQAMLGEYALRGESQMAGKFTELRKSEDGKMTYAILTYTGRVVDEGETALTTQVTFSIPTPPAAEPTDPQASSATKRQEETTVEARGAITEVRLARVTTGVLKSGTTKSRHYRAEQELVLGRKPGTDPRAGELKLVDQPVVTEANSWLTYVDPQHRFFFQHPQDLLTPGRFQLKGSLAVDSFVLLKTRPEGRDYVRFDVFCKDPTPEALKSSLKDQWAQMKLEVVPGAEEWLPDAEWTSMKVYRIEAALKLPTRGPRGSRMHYDAYLVKLSKDAAIMVFGTTTRDGVAAFRKDVEGIIRTFHLGSPEG